MDLGPPILPRRRRARPVADAPVDALLLRLEDLTKGWLLALLEQAPLGDAPAILAAEVARDGPRVCDAVVRALADDADLRRIEPGGALELLVSQVGELAGATGIEATSRAVDTLGSVLWSAIRDALPGPDADQVSQLAERLALVIELVRGAALRRSAGEGQGPRAAPFNAGEDARDASARAVPLTPTEDPVEAPTQTVRFVPADAPSPQSFAPGDGVAPDPLWVGAVEDEIVRSDRTGTQLSLLLVELEDADRVLAVEPAGAVTATFGRFAQAVRTVVRRQDILACESETRAWIIARGTGRLGAHALGSRIVDAVRNAPPWRGAPLAVAVGVAVLGEDGRDRESLIDAAEESRFAAEASGIRVVRGGEPEESDGGSGPKLVS